MQQLKQGCTALQGTSLARQISKTLPSKVLQLLQGISLFSTLASKVQLRQVDTSLAKHDKISKDQLDPGMKAQPVTNELSNEIAQD